MVCPSFSQYSVAQQVLNLTRRLGDDAYKLQNLLSNPNMYLLCLFSLV